MVNLLYYLINTFLTCAKPSTLFDEHLFGLFRTAVLFNQNVFDLCQTYRLSNRLVFDLRSTCDTF